TINAGDIIAVNTDTGGIQMTDSAGRLSGILTLNAGHVWAATGSVLQQLADNVNFAGRNDALAASSGGVSPGGYLRAGTIEARIGSTLLVQNSGSPQLFGGLDAGAGGVSIVNTGTSPATVVAYGRQTRANGTVASNAEFPGAVSFS